MRSKKWLASGVAIGLSLAAVVLWGATALPLGQGVLPYSDLVDGPASVTMRQFTSMPGEMGPWHSHPGYVVNVVTQGAITIEDGCGGEQTFTAGQAFENLGGRVHRWKNLGTGQEVEFNTFVLPQGSPLADSFTDRRCGPPLAVSECKENGWENFDFPRSFTNQGDCVEYVRTRH